MTPKDRVPPTLLTDLYQLTMAYGYWKERMLEHEAIFHLSFRQEPFKGGYAIACGLSDAIDYLQNFEFQPDDLAYLAELRGPDGVAFFALEFLDYLQALRFACDIDFEENRHRFGRFVAPLVDFLGQRQAVHAFNHGEEPDGVATFI